MSPNPLKILLIYPFSIQRHQSSPMGLLMLATVLQNAGHQVTLLDLCAAKKKYSTKKILKLADKLKPDIIGMTLITPGIKNAYRLAAVLKSKCFKLLAGGPHATLMPKEAIEHGFDAVVLGEGEPVIEDAVKALAGRTPKDQVQGWVYKNAQNQATHTTAREHLTDLGSLPLPARGLIDPSQYGKANKSVLHSNLFSSRGCPGRCSFCSGGLFGKHFRFRSADSIIREMQNIHRAYGTSHFHFVDDAMTVNTERITKFCESLIDLKLPITWGVMTRIDTVNEDLLELLARAGCTQIEYGVESGHPETLKKIHKPHTAEMVKRIIPLTAKYGIKPYAFFILGFPWETSEHLEITLKLMRQLAPHIECFHPAIASIIIPFPGTEIYEKYKDEYDFGNWWLNSNSKYVHNGKDEYAYFESKLFSRGHVLKADFFKYSDDVRKKIYEIFKFMNAHNMKKRGHVSRLAVNILCKISEKTAKISPALEKVIFSPINLMEKLLK